MTSKPDKHNCDGCYYGTKGCACLDYHLHLNKCPCRICLVKMICSSGCEEFITFYKVEMEKLRLRNLNLGKDQNCYE